MANDDKTEKPTAKRRGEARDRGQIAKSTDLNGAVVMGAGLAGVLALGSGITSAAGSAMTTIFADIARPDAVTHGSGLHGLLGLVETALVKAIAPVAGLCLAAAVVVNLAQTRLHISRKALTPSFGKLNPFTNAKRIFGPQAGVETVKAIAKVGIVGGVVAIALIPDLTHVQAAVGTPPGALSVLLRSSVTGLAIRAFVGYLLIGLADYAYQRHHLEKSLKMTKQEVRDEGKQQDLPAEVRREIRKRQLQAARARTMAAVPRADVVVTNPTHFAVALEYSGDSPAPVVIAKGQDQIAFAIRELATEHDIPIVENPPLARALHRSVEVDQMIPVELYQAVAEVLAYVYRLAARRKRGAV